MSNVVKFKINGLSSALSNVYTRVTDLSRVELFEGETLVSDSLGNVELDIGTAGSDGQGVIVYGDNFSIGNEATFKSFSGYSVVEILYNKITLSVGQSLSIGTLNELYNPKPTQPELSNNFNTFNGTGSTGYENTLVTDAVTSNLVQYEESGVSGYYTPFTGFFKKLNPSGTNLLCNAGIGGALLQNLDLGGNTNAYVNVQKYLERAILIDPNSKVETISLIHGNANYQDSTTEYYNRLVTFKDNHLAAVAAASPASSPDFVMYQVGSGIALRSVMDAQHKYYLAGEAMMTSGTSWLGRQHPNEGPNNAPSVERLHLSVSGYRYLGDMMARAKLGVSPVAPRVYEWDGSRTIKITVDSNGGDSLVIDTSQAGIPEFAGYGIDVEKTTRELITPISVSVSGNQIIAVFGEDILANYRIRSGFTATDITNDNDNPTDPTSNFMTGTNIRRSNSIPMNFGLPNYYDWLMNSRHILTPNDGNMPAYTYGGENWMADTEQFTDGFGSRFVFSDGNMTITKDGIDNTIPTTSYITGSSNEKVAFAIKAGKSYLLTGFASIQNAGDEIRLEVGGVSHRLRNQFSGNFSQIITAITDYSISLRIVNTAIVGEISNISVREIL